MISIIHKSFAGSSWIIVWSFSVILALSLNCEVVFAARQETIPTPDWIAASPIAEKMVINGIPSVVHSFEADRSVEEVQQYYRQKWGRDASGKKRYREATVFPWHVLSKLEGRYLYTVQVKEKNSFESGGFLAVADLRQIEKKQEGEADIPRMANSRLINDTKSFDPGQEARTSMILNDYSVATNSSFYRDYYLDRGWTKMEDKPLEDASVLAFSKNDRQAHLVIRKTKDGSVVVMNQIRYE